MSKKLNWLDSFAEEQAKKLEKVATLNKKAEQVIVDPDQVPDATDGCEVTYKDKQYKVVDASYEDEYGKGVILEMCEEKTAAIEDVDTTDPMSMEVGGDPAPMENPMGNPMSGAPAVGDGKTPISTPMQNGTKKVTDAPERAVQPYQGQEAYSIGDVRDQVEPQKFQAEEAETKSQIDQENAVDRTVPEGKYSPNRIINRMVGDVMTPATDTPAIEAPATDAPAIETPTTDVPAVDETVPTEEPTPTETPVEEEPVEEDFADDDVADDVSTDANPVEETTPADTDEFTDEDVEEEEEEPVDDKKDDDEDDKKGLFASNRILKKIISRK
jgi:hypothetical protein